ncbi:MAG: CmcJ/NvfI family oxidoreductase [Steroidobacteraceae bacterium]
MDTADHRSARRVRGSMNFIGPMSERPRYHANDSSLDVLNLEAHTVEIEDARARTTAPTLQREGFALYPHASAVRDFRDAGEVARVHVPEIRDFLLRVSGADDVVVTGAGVLRFAEGSADSGRLNNSRPARFVHIDVSDATGRQFATRSAPRPLEQARRWAQYNVWRVLSPPPQDVPLALCDARSVAPQDLVAADAVFDLKDAPHWSFEGLVIRHNPAQRWSYFSNMTPREALVFKTCESDPAEPHSLPHGAFNDPGCPQGVAPRASIEMRAIAYWWNKP